MIKIIIKFYALFLIFFVSSFASSGKHFEINCYDQPIRRIEYYSGAFLDYLELYTDNNVLIKYADNPPGDPLVKTKKTKKTIINLVEGENLIGISGKIGSAVDALTFCTDIKGPIEDKKFTGSFHFFSEDFSYFPNSKDIEIFSFSGMTTTLWGYKVISKIKINYRDKYTLLPPFPLDVFIIPEKILKDRYGKETRFVADFKLDQGNLGTCTGYAAVSSLMYQVGSSELKPESIYLTGELEDGLFIEDAMQRIKKEGVALETLSKKNVRNTRWMFEDCIPIPLNISEIQAALVEHEVPIIATVNAKSFKDYKEEFKGFPNKKPKENLVANHAVLIIGYDNNKSKIIIKNSWNDGNSTYPYSEFIKGLNCAYIGKGAKAAYF